MYSIDWKNLQIRNEALIYIQHHQNEPHLILPWNLAPSVITMVPVIKQEFINAWDENLTTVPNEIVLPIPFKRTQIHIEAANKKKYSYCSKTYV